MVRPAISGALCGMYPELSFSIAYGPLTGAAARPRLALVPRIQPLAALSTSTVKSATALERQSPSGQSLTASGKVRKEVALPSQEKKEGAMQYVLFVPLPICFAPDSPLTFLQDYPGSGHKLGSPELYVAHDFRSRVLRRRDDAPFHSPI